MAMWGRSLWQSSMWAELSLVSIAGVATATSSLTGEFSAVALAGEINAFASASAAFGEKALVGEINASSSASGGFGLKVLVGSIDAISTCVAQLEGGVNLADYTSTGLLASIRRRASIPTTATTGSADADLLAYANEELQLHMAAALVQAREEYYLRHYDVALNGATYRIPTRAIAAGLRNVQLLDSGLNPVMQLSRLGQEKLAEYANRSQVMGYLVEMNSIRLFPTGSYAGASLVRLSYFERPSEIVAIGNGCRQITAINTSTNQVTVSSTTGFSTSTPCDFTKANSGFEAVAIDQTPTATLSTVLTFSSLPSTLAVGDYVSLAQTSPVPQLPLEFHPILAQRVVVRFLAAINDVEQLANAREELQRMEAALSILTSPRIEGGPRKIFQTTGAVTGNKWKSRNDASLI